MTNQFNLYFQTLKIKSPVAAQIIPGNGVTHLVFAGDDHQPWHSYSAPSEEMPGILRDLLAQAESILAGHNPLSEIDDWPASALPRRSPRPATEGSVEGPIKGLRPEPVEGPEVQHFTRKASYTPGQRPRSPITVEDLKSVDDETAMALLIERFRNSDAKIYNALLTDYHKLTGRHYKGTSDADLELDAPSPVAGEGRGGGQPSQLQLDLKTIRPHLSTIIQEGQFVRGSQTRVAEILGITNAGATNRQRILKVVRALETRLLNSSTSSTTAAQAPDEPVSNDVRVA